MSLHINFLRFIEAQGYKFQTVYDIGACRGHWSKELKSQLNHTDVILFEANPAYQQDLELSGCKYFNVVLSNPGREYVEFYNGTNTGDSYYKETTKYYDGQGSIQLACKTLDSLVQEHDLAIPNFIKIDTQGSELDILSGAENILDKVDFIYIECPVVRYNEGAPGIGEYLEFFRLKKFIPIDIYEVHRSENVLLQIDIMFARADIKDKYLGPSKFIRPLA